MVTADMHTSCCLLQKYLSAVSKLTSVHDCILGPQIGNKDSGIPTITRGIACIGKTNSTSKGPLSVGDGVEGISSVTISLVSGMVVREIFPRSMVPKAPSRVSMGEAVLHPVRAILIFPRPLCFSLAAFSSR